MTRRRLLGAAALVLGLVGLIFLTPCSEPDDKRTTVTLWHAYSGAEQAALERVTAELNASRTDLRVELVSVPYDAFPDKISAAIPNGNGPDLFIFAHDRIGDWVDKQILEPVEFFVDEPTADRFDYQAISAMSYRGELYGLPLAVKSLALFYRTDLVPEPPRTTDDLLTVGRTLSSGGRFGLAYENGKLYGHAAWLHGYGGAIFGGDGALTIATPEAARAIDFARQLAAAGIVPDEATGSLIATLFHEGRAAMVISGPWFVGDIPKSVPWAVAPLPIVSSTGRPAAPFLGAEGVMMSARARDKRAAFEVMDWLTADASAIRRAVDARQVVPNRAAYDDPRVGGDRVLAAFRKQAEVAVPMPSTPEMFMVWTPYDTALKKALHGTDPAAALAEAQREVDGYVSARHERGGK